MKERSILFFIGTLSTGGAERVVSNLSLNLPKDINRKIILLENRIDYPYNGEIKILEKPPKKFLFKRVYNLLYRCKQIRDIKKEHLNVPLISFLEGPNLFNLFTRKYGKTIISVRNHMSTKYNKGIQSFFWKSIIKYFYGKANKIIVVSEEIKNDLIRNFNISNEKIKVIYNSYAVDEINKLSKESIESEYEHIFNNPVIITAGRLNDQKGQWHLIRSFKKVKKRVPSSKLVILGSGELKEYLTTLAKELGIYEDVYFLGFKKNPFKYISKSSVFVLPSLFEGFPNALAEAMACGVPVIASDCYSGPREILAPNEYADEQISYEFSEKRFGVLLPVCDGKKYGARESLTAEEEIMAKSLEKMLISTEARSYYSKKSLDRIKDFDIKIIIKEWEKLL